MKLKLARSNRIGVSPSASIAVYRSQAECFGCDGKLAYLERKCRIFRRIYVPETIEW